MKAALIFHDCHGEIVDTGVIVSDRRTLEGLVPVLYGWTSISCSITLIEEENEEVYLELDFFNEDEQEELRNLYDSLTQNHPTQKCFPPIEKCTFTKTEEGYSVRFGRQSG